MEFDQEELRRREMLEREEGEEPLVVQSDALLISTVTVSTGKLL